MTNDSIAPQTSQSSKKILIVGCGDIGHRLAGQLDVKRFQTTGIRRHCPPDTAYLRYQPCDANQPDELLNVVSQGFDIILITMTPAERSDAGYERAYVNTCKYLVAALTELNQRPELIIFVSSTAVYAQQDGSWVDENSPTEPTNFSGKRLLEAEAVIRHSGLPHTLLRLSGIYGPGRNRLIEQVVQQRASGSPDYTNRIHVDDCAGFIAHLINNYQDISPIYVVTDCAPTPMVEVVSWIAKRLGIEDFLSTEATNERGNKRLSNRRMLSTGYHLRYQSFRDGYTTLLEHHARE